MRGHDPEPVSRSASPSRERAKELKCLYAIAEILTNPDLSAAETVRGVVERIPDGWQYPEICRCRITVDEIECETPGFERTPWIQRAAVNSGGKAVGWIEIAYLENRSLLGETPFLLEEKKLVEIIAQKLGQAIQARRTETGDDEALEARRVQPVAGEGPKWMLILELLKETDENLHRRILRRLMNHLIQLGVPGVQTLITKFDPAIYAERERQSSGQNQPLPKQDVETLQDVFEETVSAASVSLPAEEITGLIKQWLRQNKLGFLTLSAERRDVSLLDISDAVSRFCAMSDESEQALSPSDDLNIRVALTRRIFTARLPFVGVAKRYMTIHDFGRLLKTVIGPVQGTGRLGGKAAGLILASHVLAKDGAGNHAIESIRTPRTWYLASDGLIEFIHYNSLEDLHGYRFSSIDEIRHNYPYLEQVFKHSHLPPEVINQLTVALDDLGEGPLIVRSSSLLEDSEGTAFSGKYRSLFLMNLGSKEERLAALTDAIAEVYASIFGPDPIQYRAERGLLDFQEEMGILLQRVVGQRVGKYFFPAFAGVAFSRNEFRWSPRIRREDGILRIAAGIGTRVVDRTGDDYPMLVSPGQPGLRVNVTPEQAVRYSQKYIDVLNLETRRFESPLIQDIFKEVGAEFPMIEKIVSVEEHGALRKPIGSLLDPERDDLVVTFAGLIENTDFIHQMKATLDLLEKATGAPVDVEFAHDGRDLYVLQCRPQSYDAETADVRIPSSVVREHKLFTANRYVTSARVEGIRTVVYVDPAGYSKLGSNSDMVAVGDAVSRLNRLLPRRSFILMGPGRWGSRGDVTLGVPVTYADINNTLMLIEIARKRGSYVPDLSFGTHFFQDLVEAQIRYLPLYPDEDGILFREEFFMGSPNILEQLLREYAFLSPIVKVIDIAETAPGCEMCVVMDGDREQALGYVVETHSTGHA